MIIRFRAFCLWEAPWSGDMRKWRQTGNGDVNEVLTKRRSEPMFSSRPIVSIVLSQGLRGCMPRHTKNVIIGIHRDLAIIRESSCYLASFSSGWRLRESCSITSILFALVIKLWSYSAIRKCLRLAVATTAFVDLGDSC